MNDLRDMRALEQINCISIHAGGLGMQKHGHLQVGTCTRVLDNNGVKILPTEQIYVSVDADGVENIFTLNAADAIVIADRIKSAAEYTQSKQDEGVTNG